MGNEVIAGKVYRHKEGGLNYRVDCILLDATGYESRVPPKPFVLYTQLDKGKYPRGTRWVRELTDFLANFETIP